MNGRNRRGFLEDVGRGMLVASLGSATALDLGLTPAIAEESRQVFDLLLKYAVSEDGALHAEKYYRTATEEFATIRPAFRGRQMVALARVTASEQGFPAPGLEEARELLGVS
jgi:hypothetical protein